MLPKYLTYLKAKNLFVDVVAGIIMQDIYKACPIEKYFDVFNPKTGKEAGQVKMRLDFQST